MFIPMIMAGRQLANVEPLRLDPTGKNWPYLADESMSF